MKKYYEETALSELHYDIIGLRHMKTQQVLTEIREQNIKMIEDSKAINKQLFFLKWSSLVLIILIIILWFKIFIK